MDPIAACESLRHILRTLDLQLGPADDPTYDDIINDILEEIREASSLSKRPSSASNRQVVDNDLTPTNAPSASKKFASSPPSVYEKNNRLLEKMRTPHSERQTRGLGLAKLTEVKSKKRTAAQSVDIGIIEEETNVRRSTRLEDNELVEQEDASPPATKKKKGAKKKVTKKGKKAVSIEENLNVVEPEPKSIEDEPVVAVTTPSSATKVKKKKGRKKKVEEEKAPESAVANRTINKTGRVFVGTKTPLMSRVSERRSSLLPVASRLSMSVMKSVKKRPMTRRAAAAAAAAANAVSVANAAASKVASVSSTTAQATTTQQQPNVKLTKKNSIKKSGISENLNKTKTTLIVPSTPSHSNLAQPSRIPVAATPQSVSTKSVLSRLTILKDSAKKALKIGPSIQSAIDKRKMKLSSQRNPSEVKRKSAKLAQAIINEINEERKSHKHQEPQALPIIHVIEDSNMEEPAYEEAANETIRDDRDEDGIKEEKQDVMEVNETDRLLTTPKAKTSHSENKSITPSRVAVTMNGTSIQVNVRSSEEALMLKNLKSPTCKLERLAYTQCSIQTNIASSNTCIDESPTSNIKPDEEEGQDKKPSTLQHKESNKAAPVTGQYKFAGSSFKSTSSIKTIGTPSRTYQTFQSLSNFHQTSSNNYQRTSFLKNVQPTPSKARTIEQEERRKREEQLALKESRERERLAEMERQRQEKLNEKKRRDEEKKRKMEENLQKQKEEEEKRAAELSKKRAEEEAMKNNRLKSSQFTFGSAQKKNNFLPSYLNNMNSNNSSANPSKSNYENPPKSNYLKPGGLLLNKINTQYTSGLTKPHINHDQANKKPMDRNATYVLDEELTPGSPNSKGEGFTNYQATPLQPPRLKDENNYDVSGLGSEDDTDDEEEPKKPVPNWAKKETLTHSTQEQFMNMINYSALFRSAHNICVDLEEVFKKKSQKFTQRSSSAMWDSPIQLNNTAGEAEMSYMRIRTYLDRY